MSKLTANHEIRLCATTGTCTIGINVLYDTSTACINVHYDTSTTVLQVRYVINVYDITETHNTLLYTVLT